MGLGMDLGTHLIHNRILINVVYGIKMVSSRYTPYPELEIPISRQREAEEGWAY